MSKNFKRLSDDSEAFFFFTRKDENMKITRLTVDNKKLYKRYQNIKKRCYNKNDIGYKNYGGRGIKICRKWLGKNGFKNFLIWALENGYSENLQIDRIDNNKGYSPDNCRWVDKKTNMRNRRNSIKIDEKPLIEIAIEMNIKYSTLARRYKKYKDIRIPQTRCVECREFFYPYRSNQKFCSNKCRCRNGIRVKM